MNKTDLESLTVEELIERKKQLFTEAVLGNKFKQAYAVAEYLGKSLSVRYGPKYEWYSPDESVRIFLDKYGKYLTIHYAGKQVASDHALFFIPGDWFDCIEEAYPRAEKERIRRQEAVRNANKARLIEQLSI